MNDELFKRALKNNCPICNKLLEGEEETEIVDYDETKLKVHKRHIKYKR